MTRRGSRVTPSMFRWRRGAAVRALAAFVIAGASGLAAEPRVSVDLELVLAVDTSASVDAREFDLQMTGLAEAFRDPRVIAAVRRPGGIAVALVQWGGPRSQVVSVGWAHVFDADSAARVAATVAGSRRLFLMEETAIAPLLYFATGLFHDNGFDGRRRVIDVSGDGPDNSGIHPGIMRDWVVAAGITVNGLAILNEHADVDRHYRDHVIGGPGAFVMRAADYRDFADAIRRKLIREIAATPAPPPA